MIEEIKVLGLKNKVGPNGDKYLIGRWGDIWVTVRVNTEKTKDTPNDPDCFMYLTPVGKGQKESKTNE